MYHLRLSNIFLEIYLLFIYIITYSVNSEGPRQQNHSRAVILTYGEKLSSPRLNNC